jgi:hypothetical protein
MGCGKYLHIHFLDVQFPTKPENIVVKNRTRVKHNFRMGTPLRVYSYHAWSSLLSLMLLPLWVKAL